MENENKEFEDRLIEAIKQGYGVDNVSELVGKILKGGDNRMDFPVTEIIRIQEALKPLGYIVIEFKQENCLEFSLGLKRDSGIRVIPWNDPPGAIGA